MGANLNEKICSQISPADASLVDKKAFDATCSADRTEARCSFEPGEKQSPPSDDLSKQIACLFEERFSCVYPLAEYHY